MNSSSVSGGTTHNKIASVIIGSKRLFKLLGSLLISTESWLFICQDSSITLLLYTPVVNHSGSFQNTMCAPVEMCACTKKGIADGPLFWSRLSQPLKVMVLSWSHCSQVYFI